ncbi:MAG: DUF4271 domain-containing protein [Rikenellaceae bacterium]
MTHIADIPSYIFGADSVVNNLTNSSVANAAQQQFWFLGLILFVATGYLMWVNHWSVRSRNHHTLFAQFGRLRRDHILQFDELRPSFSPYTTSGSLIGMIAIWITVSSFVGVGFGGNYKLCAAILGGVAAIYIYQVALIDLISRVINGRKMGSIIYRFKSISIVMVGITTFPTVLCYALSDGKSSEILLYIIGLQFIAITAVYFYKSFVLFLSKKVSVLHTILYLCAVEIFPITLIWGFFYR